MLVKQWENFKRKLLDYDLQGAMGGKEWGTVTGGGKGRKASAYLHLKKESRGMWGGEDGEARMCCLVGWRKRKSGLHGSGEEYLIYGTKE